jgi:hypothetical protein
MQWLVSKIFNSDTHLPSSVYAANDKCHSMHCPDLYFHFFFTATAGATHIIFGASASMPLISPLSFRFIIIILIRATAFHSIACCVAILLSFSNSIGQW